MAVTVLLFALGLLCLVKGGDMFVDGACKIAKRFRVPEFLIGATVVSIGTTLPEVMVSATGAVGGNGEMAYGNAVGSVICNTALIAAITLIAAPTSRVDRKTLRTPVAFFFLSAAFFCCISYFIGDFSRLSGIVLLLIFIVYMVFTTSCEMRKGRKDPPTSENADEPNDSNNSNNLNNSKDSSNSNDANDANDSNDAKNSETENIENKKPEDGGKNRGGARREILMLVIGAAIVAVGARLLIDNGTKIATALGVPDSVIALTLVAVGTSLPELVTAVTSIIKGHGALSLGNIVGANLFNLVLVLGASVTLSPFSLPAEKTIFGVNASLAVDLPVMLVVMLILTLPALIREKLSRFQGIALLLIYVSFCAFQFVGA